jgi:hypothetical protein
MHVLSSKILGLIRVPSRARWDVENKAGLATSTIQNSPKNAVQIGCGARCKCMNRVLSIAHIAAGRESTWFSSGWLRDVLARVSRKSNKPCPTKSRFSYTLNSTT